MVKCGTLFFLDAGSGAFGVAAAHVVIECLNDAQSPMFVQCILGRENSQVFPFHLEDHLSTHMPLCNFAH